jgi:hypothetical protein
MLGIARFLWMDKVVVVFSEATVDDKTIAKIVILLFDFLADCLLECIEKCFKSGLSAFTAFASF